MTEDELVGADSAAFYVSGGRIGITAFRPSASSSLADGNESMTEDI